MPVGLRCKICNKVFKVKPYMKNKAKYCSRKCFGKSNIGKTHSEETKRKMSVSSKPNSGCFKKGKESILWKGGEIKNTGGYIIVHNPNHPFSNHQGYVLEHRLIVEAYIGRYLKPEEVVHHINKIVDDNRLENLILFKSGSKHIKHHRSLDRLNRNNISR